MLTLSLPRGLGLMFVVAPVYRPNKRRKPRPKLCCPPVSGDLLEDARDLYAHNNVVAAAMTARVELERQLTKLALLSPAFGEDWRGVHETAHWLNKHGMLRKATLHSVKKANSIGNCAAHGKPVTKAEVQEMFAAIESLRQAVVRKGGAA
jgi:hypothetical protein